MELTYKEFEFLNEIEEADERGNTIIFQNDDQEKVTEYLKKYGDVYEKLKYAPLMIKGAIGCGSGLQLGINGKKALQEERVKRENAKTKLKENKKSKIVFIITVLGLILGIISIYVTIHFSK